MNGSTDFDRALAAWLEAGGPGPMPGALVRDAVADARTRRRRRPSRVWRWHVPRVGRYPLGIVAIGLTAALIAGLIAGLAGVGQHPSPIPADRGVFRRTGSPLTPRGFETATTLLDGRVLVVGGYAGHLGADTDTDTAELWDPGTGLFSPAGSTVDHRDGHSATLLQDGRVLIIGGFGSGGVSTSAEIWDPRSMTFSPTGSLAVGRARYQGATWLLPDGRVLVVGGMAADGSVVTTPEVWDPRTDTFGPADALPESRRPAGTLLADGGILVVDGHGARTWDPTTGAFTPAGTPGVLRDTTQNATATVLTDGRVLLVGGSGDGAGYLASAEIWNPADRRFDPTGAMTVGRAYAAAALLHDGRVLVVGGRGGFDSAEAFGFEDAPTASPSGRAVPSADH